MAMGEDGTPPRPGMSKIVGVSWNANGLNARKRREMVEMFKKKGMDVLGVQETHMKGNGMLECKMGSDWVYLGVRALVGAMKAAGGGSIINISSVQGLRGGAAMHGYSASKWGVRGLTKSLAVELGVDGIRVNSVHPGFVETDMTVRLDAGRQIIPLGRTAQPGDLVGTVLFLAGDASAYVTGTELVVDGGLSATCVAPNPNVA